MKKKDVWAHPSEGKKAQAEDGGRVRVFIVVVLVVVVVLRVSATMNLNLQPHTC